MISPVQFHVFLSRFLYQILILTNKLSLNLILKERI
jgi:hypothetical protein